MAQNTESTDILVRSKGMPETPFDTYLKYQGIEVVVHVIENLDSASDVLRLDVLEDELEANVSDLGELVLDERFLVSDKVANSTSELISMWSKAVGKEENIYVVYKSDLGIRYAVRLGFRFVYELVPLNGWTKILCREVNEYKNIPDSTPTSNMEGEIDTKSDSSLLFTESGSVWSRITHSSIEIELERTDTRKSSLYDLYQLTEEKHVERDKQEQVSEYCSGEISVNKDEYIIECQSEDGSIFFRIPLTSFGTLPDWFEDRIDIDELLSKMNNNKSILFEVKSSSNSTDDKWMSEIGDKELLGIE